MALKNKYSNFRDFIKNYNSFSIPYYQRKYVWSKPENEFVLKKFLQDIIEVYDSDINSGKTSEYFIGNFALYTRNKSFIIDGQQRISTLVMLLAILFKKTGDPTSSLYTPDSHFIINSDSTLGGELEYFLFGKKPSDMTIDPNSPISSAITLIDNEITKLLRYKNIPYLQGLETFIFSNITLSYIEFGNERESLKYFLNINSLSIQLTEMEIFSAFVSQVIAFLNTNKLTIENVRSTLDEIDKKLNKVSAEDLVSIFLKSYYMEKDDNIGQLNDKKSKTGIGRWLTCYKMNLLSDATKATEFLNALAAYISDIEVISNCLIGKHPSTNEYKFIWFISIFNKYTKNLYLKDLLLWLFCNRHDYGSNKSIYKKGTTIIDLAQLDSYCKCAASVIVVDYFRGDIRKLSRKDDASDMSLSTRTRIKQNASLTIKNISYPNMWSLRCPRDRQDPKYTIPDNSECIFFILALQEAYLNSIANVNYNGKIVNILNDLLDPNQNYQIEHLITKDDFTREARKKEWVEQGAFTTSAEFDEFRSKFENLSLLDGMSNASANSKTIATKLNFYKNANTITNTNEPEYLVQSLVANSNYYRNTTLGSLGSRDISIDMNGITWKHNKNNRAFIEKLSEKAVAELFK